MTTGQTETGEAVLASAQRMARARVSGKIVAPHRCEADSRSALRHVGALGTLFVLTLALAACDGGPSGGTAGSGGASAAGASGAGGANMVEAGVPPADGSGSGGAGGDPARDAGTAGTAATDGSQRDGGPGDGSANDADERSPDGDGGGADAVSYDGKTDVGGGADAGSYDGKTDDGGGADHASDSADPAIDLKVVTFNIRYANPGDGINAWPSRREMLYRVLREQDGDVVGLQEALIAQLDDIAAALPQYQRIGVGRDDGRTAGEFSAILYRASRFDVESSGTFWFSDTPEVPGSTSFGNTTTRICTWGRFIEKGSGRSYYLFNVHLDNVSQPSREKSVQLLMRRVAERAVLADPFIVTGDFNAGEANLATQYVKGAASIAGMVNPIPLVDSFRELHPTATNVGTFHNFLGGTSGDKIDFIFMAPHEKALAATIDHTQENNRYPSDHFPVTAAIDMLNWN